VAVVEEGAKRYVLSRWKGDFGSGPLYRALLLQGTAIDVQQHAVCGQASTSFAVLCSIKHAVRGVCYYGWQKAVGEIEKSAS